MMVISIKKKIAKIKKENFIKYYKEQKLKHKKDRNTQI